MEQEKKEERVKKKKMIGPCSNSGMSFAGCRLALQVLAYGHI